MRKMNELFEERRNTVDEEGEIHSSVNMVSRSYDYESEGLHAKTYPALDDKLLDLSITSIRLFSKLTHMMDFADNEQIVRIDKTVRQQLMRHLGVKMAMIDHSLRQLRDNGLIRRLSRGVYAVNPFYASRGKWGDVKILRKRFHEITGDVEIDFGRRDSKK